MLLCFFVFSSRRRHTRCALVTGVQTCALPISGMTAAPIPTAELERIIERAAEAERWGLIAVNAESAALAAELIAAREALASLDDKLEIGRASCRERVWQYV